MAEPSWKPEPSGQEIFFFKYQNEPYVDLGAQIIREEEEEG